MQWEHTINKVLLYSCHNARFNVIELESHLAQGMLFDMQLFNSKRSKMWGE